MPVRGKSVLPRRRRRRYIHTYVTISTTLLRETIQNCTYDIRTITITNGDTWNILRLIAYCIVLLWLFKLSYPQCTSKCQTSESALIVTDYSTLHYHHYMLLWQSHLIQSCCISITYHHGSTKRYQKLGTTRHTIEQRLVVERTRTTQVLPNITIHYWSQTGLYCRIVPPKGVPL